jgi:hypothetical protein
MPTRDCYFVLLGTCTTTRSPSLKPTPALISRHDADQTVPFTREACQPALPRDGTTVAARAGRDAATECAVRRRTVRGVFCLQRAPFELEAQLRHFRARARHLRIPAQPPRIAVSGCSSCANTSNRVACSHRTATRHAAAHLAISLVNLLRCLMPNEKARD